MKRFYISLTDDQGTLIDRVYIEIDPKDPEMKVPRTFDDVEYHIMTWGYEYE